MSLFWCDDCQGTGSLDCRCGGDTCVCENQGELECPKCKGDGQIAEEEDDYL